MAIVPTVTVNMTPMEANVLGKKLGEAITAKLQADVLAGDDIARRLPPEGIPDGCVSDTSCITTLGGRFDADDILFLVIVKLDANIQLDAILADVQSGKTTSRPRVELGPNDDIESVLSEAAPSLVPHIPRVVTAKKQEPIVVVTQAPAPVNNSSSRRITTPVWVAGGVAAVAGVTATAFGLSARQKFNDLDDGACRTQLCSENRIDTGERHALIADLAWGVTAAAAATGIVLFFLSDDDNSEAPLRVDASSEGASVSIGGSF